MNTLLNCLLNAESFNVYLVRITSTYTVSHSMYREHRAGTNGRNRRRFPVEISARMSRACLAAQCRPTYARLSGTQKAG